MKRFFHTGMGLCAGVLLTLSGHVTAAPSWDTLLEPPQSKVSETARASTAEKTEKAVAKTAADAPSYVYLEPDQVLAQLHGRLVDQYELEGELLLFPLRSLSTLRFVGEWVEVRFEGLASRTLRANLQVHYRILVDGQPVRRMTLPLRLEHWVEVWQARESFEREDRVSLAKLESKAIETLQRRTAAISATEDLSQYEFARPVSAGTALSWRHLTPRLAVRQGALVDVVAREGLLSVSLKAQALEDGKIGETIRLRNLQSRREFAAQVTAENVLQIQL